MMLTRNVPLRGIADSIKRESAPPAQDTSFLEQPDFYIDWTEAATGAALPGAWGPIGDMLNEGAVAIESEAPGAISDVSDFVNGYVRPASAPPSAAGAAGAAVRGLTNLF